MIPLTEDSKSTNKSIVTESRSRVTWVFEEGEEGWEEEITKVQKEIPGNDVCGPVLTVVIAL